MNVGVRDRQLSVEVRDDGIGGASAGVRWQRPGRPPGQDRGARRAPRAGRLRSLAAVRPSRRVYRFPSDARALVELSGRGRTLRARSWGRTRRRRSAQLLWRYGLAIGGRQQDRRRVRTRGQPPGELPRRRRRAASRQAGRRRARAGRTVSTPRRTVVACPSDPIPAIGEDLRGRAAETLVVIDDQDRGCVSEVWLEALECMSEHRRSARALAMGLSRSVQLLQVLSTASTRRWSSGVVRSPSLSKMLVTCRSIAPTVTDQPLGDRSVRAALRDQRQHLVLARRQLRQRAAGRRGRATIR